MNGADRIPVALGGVAETALWNLYHRAVAARGTRSSFQDPRAVELVERFDYPFERFGNPFTAVAAQLHARRVMTGDDAVRGLIARHPAATIAALGDGFETQFWRVDDGRVRWLSIDGEEVVGLRRAVLADGPRNHSLAASATDPVWIDHLGDHRPVIVTAQGLFMYLERAQVHRTIGMLAERLPGQHLVFDTVTPLVQQARRRGAGRSGGYQPPEWHWVLDDAERRALRELPALAELIEVPAHRGTSAAERVLSGIGRAPGLKEKLPSFPVFRATLRSAR